MVMSALKRDEVILLLGAGASVEAAIPDSNSMIKEIENLVSGDKKWRKFQDLYHYIKSSIFYADGLDGKFGDSVPLNIERFVNVLDELHKKERHELYPFVGAWNPKLVDVAGGKFEHIFEFRKQIVDILRKEWIALPEKEKADYYSGLLRFQTEYEYPIRVFSLNYDLCVERVCGQERVQRGFSERTWDWRVFDETSEDPFPLLLYKLHGSLDWYFKDGQVQYSDSPSTITDESIALIFGTSYKLQYIDPFLFFAYELRRWTLDTARIIVCVGYGFNDDHINGILQQALHHKSKRKLLAVVGPSNEASVTGEEERIRNLLEAKKDQIKVQTCGAKKFLNDHLTIASLSELLPPEENLFPESPGPSRV